MKWIGCVLFFLAVMQMGARKVERLQRSMDLLYDVWFAVEEIGRQITMLQLPLPRIYQALVKGEQGRTNFFKRLHETGSFWRAFREIEQDMFAQKELAQDMDRFLQALGKTDAIEQERLCRGTAAKLRERLDAVQESFPQRRRMYLSVAACVGGMLVLFML